MIAQIDDLLEDHTDAEVARLLNERGLQTGADAPFSPQSVKWIRYSAGLKSLKQRLRDQGWMTTKECAVELGVHSATVKAWRRRRLLEGRTCNAFGEWLFEPNSIATCRSPTKTQLRKQESNDHVEPAA